MTALRYAISDTLILAKRSVLPIPRQPDLLVGFTVQPVKRPLGPEVPARCQSVSALKRPSPGAGLYLCDYGEETGQQSEPDRGPGDVVADLAGVLAP